MESTCIVCLLFIMAALLVVGILYLHLLLREVRNIIKGLGHLQDTILRSHRS